MIVYMVLMAAANVAAALIFHKNIVISEMSILPVFLLVLSAFQAYYFYHHREKKDFNINNDSELTEAEWEVLSKYMSRSYLISLPLYIPFALFGGTLIKALSAAVFFAAFAGGAAVYKAKFKKQVAARIEKEYEELSEQRKKEELGDI